MKLLSAMTIAALVTAGAAFASTAPTATPATSVAPATAAPAAKNDGDMHCAKQAKDKRLTAEAARKFIKECKEAKKSN
jgi:hypothetical protein